MNLFVACFAGQASAAGCAGGGVFGHRGAAEAAEGAAVAGDGPGQLPRAPGMSWRTNDDMVYIKYSLS